jgi:hypothetical protein
LDFTRKLAAILSEMAEFHSNQPKNYQFWAESSAVFELNSAKQIKKELLFTQYFLFRQCWPNLNQNPHSWRNSTILGKNRQFLSKNFDKFLGKTQLCRFRLKLTE